MIETGYCQRALGSRRLCYHVRGLDPSERYLGTGGQFSVGHRVLSRFSTLGVTNAAFVDGSCRRLLETMDSTVLEAIVTVAGEEISPEF